MVRFSNIATLKPLTALIVCLVGLLASGLAAERPNVLFISADDLRMNLGCYGDEVAVTPNLDRLAEEGTLFNRAYCQFPSCNASRASLLTGMRPDTISVWRLNTHFRKTAPDVVTLPQYFKKRGYWTEAVGKVLHNYNQIKDDALSWSTPARFAQVGHFGDYGLEANKPEKGKGMVAENVDVGDDAYADGEIAADAVATIERLAQQDQPFFLAVGFLKPHSPYNAPKKYWDLYDREDMKPLGPVTAPEGVTDLAWFYFREIRSFPDVPDEGIVPESLAMRMRHGYYAASSYMDANVGKLLDALERSGLAENTIVVFWSDHGYHLGENGHWAKVTARDLDAHVPLIVRVPGQKPLRSDAIVEYIDLYPTLAEACGLEAPPGLDGESFFGALSDPAAQGKQAAFTQVMRPWIGDEQTRAMGYSMRDRRYRYTRWRHLDTGETLAEELYDNQSDTLERRNLIANPEYEALRARLRAQMDQTLKL